MYEAGMYGRAADDEAIYLCAVPGLVVIVVGCGYVAARRRCARSRQSGRVWCESDSGGFHLRSDGASAVCSNGLLKKKEEGSPPLYMSAMYDCTLHW